MENVKEVRLIDELGRIVLPAGVRGALEWEKGTRVEIRVNAAEDGVMIKRYAVTCTFCGETAGLKRFGKKHICPACQKKIARL